MPDKQTRQDADAPAERTASKSMHDGVPVWCDCCSCEAEPYWLEAFEHAHEDELSDTTGSIHQHTES